jgi:molybdenum cofactor cytidylyltransferase
LLAAVILSAGASSRMGRPKALLPYREGTFLEHLMEVTRDPRIEMTRVVLGAGAETIRAVANLDPSVVILNSEWEKGQLSSIRAGLRSLDGVDLDGMILCPVDHPLVSALLVSELVTKFYELKKAIVLPTYKGRRGHPVIFSKQLFGELLSAPEETGARAVVWAHAGEVLEVPTDEEGVILNLNAPDMLKRATGQDAK